MNNSSSQILLLTHGDWGKQLKESLSMILGKIEGVFDITLTANDTFNEFYEKVKQQVVTMPKGSLILTDFISGTTSNVAARLSLDYPIAVISGLNALLLIEAINRKDEGPLMNIVDELVGVGQESCKDVLAEIKQKFQEN